jgi:hypothetical protein
MLPAISTGKECADLELHSLSGRDLVQFLHGYHLGVIVLLFRKTRLSEFA